MFIEFGGGYINLDLVRYIDAQECMGSWKIIAHFSNNHCVAERFENYNCKEFEKRMEYLIRVLNDEILELVKV